MVAAALQQLARIFMVFGLVFEKLVDVFDGADAKLLFCNYRKTQVAHLIAEQGLVKKTIRPGKFPATA